MEDKEKFILDACCGKRMMWFDKNQPNTIYLDNREEVNSDLVGDFRQLPYKEKSFKLVAWDVPHIVQKRIGKGKVAQSYGVLDPENWKEDLKKGFEELWRVLDDYGILIFKWSDCDKWSNQSRNVNLKEVLKLFHTQPLFGHKTKSKIDIKENKQLTASYWLCFMKIPEKLKETKEKKEEIEQKVNFRGS